MPAAWSKKIEEKGGKSRQVKLDKFSKFIDKLLKKNAGGDHSGIKSFR